MKYIRRYNESFEETTYEKISADDYESFFQDRNIDSFTRREMSTIINIIESWDDKYEVAYDVDNSIIRLKFGIISRGSRQSNGRYFGTEINIVKLDDGWYMINTISKEDRKLADKTNTSYDSYRKFYKCDQFESVINFLGDFSFN